MGCGDQGSRFNLADLSRTISSCSNCLASCSPGGNVFQTSWVLFLETFGSSVQNWYRATYLYNLETFSFLALSQHWSERWERWGPRRENGGFWRRQNKNRQRLAVITGGWVKDGGAVQETDEQPASLYSFVFYFLYLYLNSHLCFFVFEARHFVSWIMLLLLQWFDKLYGHVYWFLLLEGIHVLSP